MIDEEEGGERQRGGDIITEQELGSCTFPLAKDGGGNFSGFFVYTGSLRR